jgi:hypothetical protein
VNPFGEAVNVLANASHFVANASHFAANASHVLVLGFDFGCSLLVCQIFVS